MRLTGFFILLLLIVSSPAARAQKSPELAQSRVLILLDESSSMINTWGTGKPKYKAARDLILRLMDSVYAVNDKVEFSLRVFGHQHTVAENNCYDTKNEVPFSKKNRTQMEFRLDDISPLGVTAIAYSLQQAAQYDLPDEEHNAYSIILITDGGESCGGNICEVMRTLIANKVYFKPYIVSLEDYPELRNTYNCMGDYLQVTKEEDIPKAVNTIVNAFRPIIKLTQSEYKQIVAKAPSILRVNVPDVTTPARPARDTETPAPIQPEPKIKVEETPQPRAKGSKINALPSVTLRTFRFTPVPATPVKPARVNIVLPPIVMDPPPPPPVVRPAPIKIARLTPASRKNFNTYLEFNSEKAKTMQVAIKLPPLVIDTPKPPVVVVTRPAPQKITRLALQSIRTLPIGRSAAARVATTVAPAIPTIVIDVPPPPPPVVVRPAPVKIARRTTDRQMQIAIKRATAARMKPAKVPAMPTFVFDVPMPPAEPPKPIVVVNPRPAPVKVAKVPLARKNKMNVVFVVDQGTLRPMKVPAFPKFKIDVPKTAVSNTATLPVSGSPNISIESVDAKETTVEVYLTNGKGKFYETSPVVILSDVKNPTTIKQFYRTVDFNGTPDPQPMIPGTYNLTFQKKRDLVKNNIRIEPNKKTRITVVIKPVSLTFAYNGAPTRSVTEYDCQVTERNKKKGRVQVQRCIDRVEYEPGNYHVIINSFPQERRNVDLDIDGEYIMYIDQPGFAKFTSENKMIVTLWMEDGDRFKPFHQLDLNDPRSQHLQIRPGKYQVHYRKGPGGPSQSEKVKPFSIIATRETEIIID